MNARRAGPSVHIGVNDVNPGSYTFHVPPLKGCLNDAYAMRDLAAQRGYQPSLFTDGAATAANVQGALHDAVAKLTPDQTLLVTYAGHGSQVSDTNRDEEDDRLDETWVLADRQLIDDELAAVWSLAPAGARILIVSDSCHSGSVARTSFAKAVNAPAYRIPGLPSAQVRYGDVSRAAAGAVLTERFAGQPAGFFPWAVRPPDWPFLKEKVVAASAEALEDQWAQASGVDVWRKPRMLDPDLADRDLNERRDLYRPFLSLAAGGGPLKASVLLLSACRDHQTALDGREHGLFTQELLNVLQSGRYRGYQQFVDEIEKRVDLPDHRPRLFWASTEDPAFAAAEPFAP